MKKINTWVEIRYGVEIVRHGIAWNRPEMKVEPNGEVLSNDFHGTRGMTVWYPDRSCFLDSTLIHRYPMGQSVFLGWHKGNIQIIEQPTKSRGEA